MSVGNYVVRFKIVIVKNQLPWENEIANHLEDSTFMNFCDGVIQTTSILKLWVNRNESKSMLPASFVENFSYICRAVIVKLNDR